MDAGCTITWVSSACFRFLAAFEEQKNLLEFFFNASLVLNSPGIIWYLQLIRFTPKLYGPFWIAGRSGHCRSRSPLQLRSAGSALAQRRPRRHLSGMNFTMCNVCCEQSLLFWLHHTAPEVFVVCARVLQFFYEYRSWYVTKDIHDLVWFGFQQFTEVLGCDDACPGSQCSQIQKMSAEERASAGPPILGFRYNGLNSYETLIFAPRYWAWAIGGDLNSFMGSCANWFGNLKAWKKWGSGKDFGESCYSLCWRYLLPSITYSLWNYQLTCWWAIATFLLLVTPPECVYRFERISCKLNSASQFDLASELPMVNQENLAWTGILEWKRLEISRMLCLSVFCLIHLKIICLCNQWTKKDIGTGIHCLCS